MPATLTPEQAAVALRTFLGLGLLLFLALVWLKTWREDRFDAAIHELDERMHQIFNRNFENKNFPSKLYFELSRRIWVFYGKSSQLTLAHYLLCSIGRSFRERNRYESMVKKVRDPLLREELTQIHYELLLAMGKRMVYFEFLAKRLTKLELFIIYEKLTSELVEADT